MNINSLFYFTLDGMETHLYWIAAAVTVLVVPMTAVAMGYFAAAGKNKEDTKEPSVEQEPAPGSAKKAKWKKKKALKRGSSSMSADGAAGEGGAATPPGSEAPAPTTPRGLEGGTGADQSPPDSADKAVDTVSAAEATASRPVVTRSNSGHSVPELDMR